MADTLTFVAQWDPALSATNSSWFYANNWWLDTGTNLVSAGRVPLANETAIVTGTVDTGMTSVRVSRLVLTNGATVMNGTYAAEYLEMQSNSSFQNAHVNVLTFGVIGGTNCTLDGATLNVLSIASMVLNPAATLNLANGALLSNVGALSLTDGSQIITLGGPQSTLAIQTGAVLVSTDLAVIHGSASSPLAIDNSGLIRVDRGSLTFSDAIQWQSSAYLGEFRAAATNTQVVFASPMLVAANVTDLFTGPGMNRFQAGATIDGFAQVGVNDLNTQSTAPGNLVVDESVAGMGLLHIVASPSQAASLTWNDGTFSLPDIAMDHGAEMVIAGEAGTMRRLSGCAIYNSGVCTLVSPDLAMENAASINNLADGVFEVQADGTFSGFPMPSGGEFNNDGLFRKTSPGVTLFGTNNAAQGPDFNNNGTVDLRSGGLSLLTGSGSGEFHSEAGTTLWFRGGTYVLNDGAVFTGIGSVKLRQEVTPAAWQVKGSIAVAELELGSNGTVAGSGAPSETVGIAALAASDNGLLTNANFEIGTMLLEDQALVADSALSITNSLAVQGTNCSLDGSSLNVAAAAMGVLSSGQPGVAAKLNLSQGAVLQNSGLLSLQDGSLITSGGLPQSKLLVLPGGIVACTNSGIIRGSAAEPLVVDNTGLFRVDSGTLTFDGGIEWQSGGGIEQFEAAAPTSLILFAADFQVPADAIGLFGGPGTNRFFGSNTIDGAIQAGTVAPDSQTIIPANFEFFNDLSGSGSLEVLGSTAQASSCIWNQGTLSLATINIRPTGKFLVGGEASAPRQLSGCAINDFGLLSWRGQLLSAGAGAVLNILAGGTLDIQNDGQLAFNDTPPALAIRNSGSILKSGGTGTNAISASLMNLASLQVQTGTLAFDQTIVQSAGNTVVDAGAVFAAPALTIQGGTVSGTGLINAKVTNGGTVAPGPSVGILSLAPAADFAQTAAGVLLMKLAGTADSQYDQLEVGGNAQLGGELRLQFVNGFVPEPGQAFTVLACSKLSGVFTSVNAPSLPGLVWVPRYNGTNVTVTLANELNLPAPAISDGSFSFSFNTTPGVVYVIQATDDLTVPAWQTVATIEGNGQPQSFAEPTGQPRRFYRVLLQ